MCVKKDEYVRDDAASQFTKIFYQNLLAQNTVCQSFKSAKATVEAELNSKESDLFMLLVKEDEYVDLVFTG